MRRLPAIFPAIPVCFTRDDAGLSRDQRLLRAYAEFTDGEIQTLLNDPKCRDPEAAELRRRVLSLRNRT